MAEHEWLDGGITAVPGILAAGVAAGVKPSGKKDFALIYSSTPARVAAVFTTSQVKGAPVVVSREHVRGGMAQAIVGVKPLARHAPVFHDHRADHRIRMHEGLTAARQLERARHPAVGLLRGAAIQRGN